jgi:hypothetical protein
MADAGRSLPEFTRALRAFGSRRGRTGLRSGSAEQQTRFFAPLVEARRVAASAADDSDVLHAFDAAMLTDAFRAILDEFAASRYPDYPAARRALEAHLAEMAEPLVHALDGVAAARAAMPAQADPNEALAWSRAVQHVFEVADRVWLSIDAVLERAATADFAPRPQGARAPRRRRGA